MKGRRNFFDDELGYREILNEMNEKIADQLALVLGEVLMDEEIEEEVFNKAVEMHSADEDLNEAFENLCIPEM